MMFVIKLFRIGVILVLLVSIKISYSQDDEVAETTTLEAAADVNDVICSLCACADGVVNCANLNISSPFEITDWDALQYFNPKTINLSQNLLTSVTRISKLPIQALNFSSCEISTIEDATFIYLEDLASLDLSRNKLPTAALNRKVFVGPIDPAIGPREFKRMQYLSLAHNDLHALPQDVFIFMTGITYLDLSGNPLAYIDQVTMGSISDLTNLRELRLSSCELETLPEGLLRRQRKLRRLDLSNNRFTTIPSALQEASYLVYLNLDKNSIQTLGANNAITKLTRLQELHMMRCSRLQNITAGALGGLSNLLTLYLSYNPRLTNLDPSFLVWTDIDGEEQWPMINEIYLNNNNLSTINSGILDNWNDLKNGDFTNNPYNCDCSNQWMVDVLVPLLSNTPAGVGNIVCKKPLDLRGLTFAQLHNASRTLVCPEPESLTDLPVSNMAILLGIMIGIMVTFPLVLILVLLWRRGFFSRFRSRKNHPKDYYDETEDL